MAGESRVRCAVCDAENLAGAHFCSGCGIKMGEATPTEGGEDLDRLLEELGEAEGAPPGGTDEDLDLDTEIVTELLDSLLIDEPEAPAAPETVEEFECPLCGTSLPVDAVACVRCGARFEEAKEGTGRERRPRRREDAPRVEVTEEASSRFRMLSGRLIDVAVAATAVALLAVFLGFGMYAWSALTPFNVAVFFGIAAAGWAATYALSRISVSAATQGDRLVREGRYAEAINLYDRAIRMGAKPSMAWTSKGVVFKRLGMHQDALRCHRIALKIDPKNEIAWCNMGDVHYREGDLEKAVACYDNAIAANVRYAIAWNNKGAALARAGRLVDAKECHEMAVKLRPRYRAAWLNRGEVLLRLGKRKEAQKCLERAKALGS